MHNDVHFRGPPSAPAVLVFPAACKALTPRAMMPGAACTSTLPFEHDGPVLIRHRRTKWAEPT
jgi:hypothetical protein